MSKRVLVAVLAIVSLFGLFSAFAQSAALSGEPLLRALLEEMRAIRLAMQTSSAQELRGRLLIERIKMQQEVVRELSREIEQTPNAAISAETDHFAEMEEDIERRVRAETEPERKRMIEREKERIKRRREMEVIHREQARVR
ncbi:MAG TPA: hypothetical protein VFL80_06630, partial [Thermoanaerobaculia bacterium]|nr:hypothetical protein [Thermoanaerobaculia bacterium]